ncbi:L-threonylcarbamoyladenylate synthase [Ideonella sp. A 288]|uniref:L-threonylcarbamoyladenylate synthase n=1 Tax=Ideonella sp. A 288 TaxID=1962181 RepID=UPI000B4AE81A|nr:L-threonylcarbamoyladenylate synthase [Ideonella sp. A 288]
MPLLDGTLTSDLDVAARALAAGDLVAFPTETVYGLGARADDDAAVARIFTAKGRPSDHPLIVHVADLAGARHFASALDDSAQRLVRAFWPGPLTIIVPRRAGVATSAAGGQSSIGLRCPAHPVAQALLRRCAELGVAGLAGPSANRFGRISPTTAAHVADDFGAALPVLDGGPCAVGIESAIVDCSRGRPVLLRPGVLTRAALQQALGLPLEDRDADAPRASGTLEAHYAPRARLRLADAATLQALPAPGSGLAVYSRTCPALPSGARWSAMPGDAAQAARELFAALRALDTPDVRQIWVEQPPEAPEWEGVRDRLRRAAASA